MSVDIVVYACPDHGLMEDLGVQPALGEARLCRISTDPGLCGKELVGPRRVRIVTVPDKGWSTP